MKTDALEIVEVNGFGIFDEDDLCDETAEPWVTFRTEDEAKGYLLLMGEGGCATPVVRPVALKGTVFVPSETT